MASSPLGVLVRDLRRAVLFQDAAGLSDGQLLEWFLAQREEAAFELLVRRHGPMVLGVCRRVLRHAHDAEDAFQATFLVLMRKAGSITKREMLGAWLYGVAFRIAVRAKAMNAKRRLKERQVREMSRNDGPEESDWQDLEPLLDQEVNRLPAKYRVPLVLCELEGRSRKEVAEQLGLAEGTLSSRLSRARDFLRKRLTARGLTLGSATLTLALSQNVVSAAVPAALVTATVKAATAFGAGQAAIAGVLSSKVTALAQGAIKALLVAKLKVALVVLLGVGVLCAGIGAGVRGYLGWGDQRVASAPDTTTEDDELALLEDWPEDERAAPLPPKGHPGELVNAGMLAADPDEAQPNAEPDERDLAATEPPADLDCDPFYKKYVSAKGLPILSSDKVSDRALQKAAYLVNRMLDNRPDVREALIQADVRFVVMHRTEKTTAFPEQRDLKPKEAWDKLRGLGDFLRNCGEENLLNLPCDPYRGKVVLIHQVALAVYINGLDALDEDFKPRLKQLYKNAMAKGLWKGTRAAINPAEYWSEAVSSYFDANRARVRSPGFDGSINTREALEAHDPEMFQLIDAVFRQAKWRYQLPDKCK